MNDAKFIEYLQRALENTGREIKVYPDWNPANPFEADWLEIGEYGLAKLESGKVLLTRGYQTSGGPGYYDPPEYDMEECGEFSYPSAVAEAILTNDLKDRLDGLSETMAYEEEVEERNREYAAGRL